MPDVWDAGAKLLEQGDVWQQGADLLNQPEADPWAEGQKLLASQQQPKPEEAQDFGSRADGTKKGTGFLGVLKRPDGSVSTEISIGVNLNGKETEIPTLVPTLTKDEVDHLLKGGRPTKAIVDKAVQHAEGRIAKGKSPFADNNETPKPEIIAKELNPPMNLEVQNQDQPEIPPTTSGEIGSVLNPLGAPQSPVEALNTPLVKTAKLSSEEIAKALPEGTPSAIPKVMAGTQRGVAKFVEGLTTPLSIALATATGGASKIPGVGPAVSRIVSGLFAINLGHDAAKNAGEAASDFVDGNIEGGSEKLTEGSLEGLLGLMAAGHAVKDVAASNPKVRAVIQGKIEEKYSPAQMKEILQRVTTNKASPIEIEIAQILNQGKLAPQAAKSGAQVTTSKPIVSEPTAEFLGAPQEPTSVKVQGVTLQQGQPAQVANALTTSEPIAPPVDEATAPTPEPPAAPTVPMVQGAETVVKGAKGVELPATYVVMPRNLVNASHTGEQFSANPNFPLENPRDYSKPEEQEKVINVRNNFDPREYVTDSPDAAVGPVVTATVVTDENPQGTVITLGGNNRKQAIDLMSQEKRDALQDLTEKKAEQFGLKDVPKDAQLARHLGTFDLRQPGVREKLQGVMDVLNPSPGLVQSVAKMAENDAASSVAPSDLSGLSMQISPKDAQFVVTDLIRRGLIDRNLRTSIAQSEAAATDYVQRMLVNTAFRSPTIAEFRQVASDKNQTARAMVDAAVPALLEMRKTGRNELADGITQTFHTVIDYTQKNGMQKIRGALDMAAKQLEMGEGGKVIQSMANAMKDEIVLKGGKVQPQASEQGLNELFASIGKSVEQYRPEADIFGNLDSVEAAIQRGIDYRQRLKTKGETVEQPEPAMAGEGSAARAPKVVDEVKQIMDGAADFNPETQGLKAFEGKRGSYVNVPMAHLDKIRIVEMPELVKIVRNLGSDLYLKKLPKAMGYFKGHGTKLEIVLDPKIFVYPDSAAKVLAHELGHLVDYLPDYTMKRGNLIGRLMTLRKFLKEKFGPSEVGNKEIREELKKLTQYWKPFEEAMVPAWYKSYRYSAAELYADAVSVLFNSPATLKEMAPKFWKGFFNYLDLKPEVKSEFQAMQELLNRDPESLAVEREADIKAGYAKAEEVFMRKWTENKLRYQTFRGFQQRIRREMLDKFSPILDRQKAVEKRGVQIPDDLRMDFVFGEHPLAGNHSYLFLNRMFKEVVKPLEDAGLTLEELGVYVQLRRIALEQYEVTNKLSGQVNVEGRSTIANPEGHTKQTASDQLGYMAQRLGTEQWAMLEEMGRRFHDLYFGIVRQAYEAELIPKETFENIIVPNKDTYATFVPIDYVDVFVPSAIYKQVGTLSSVENPFIATVLKGITMLRAVQYQKAKLNMVKFLKEYFPDEIRQADLRWDGKRYVAREPKSKDQALLEMKERGRYNAYEVDRDVALMFDNTAPSTALAIAGAVNWAFRNFFHPIFIRYNPVFQLYASPVRDFQRSFVNAPDKIGPVKLAREYLKSIPSAMARLKAEDNPLITEMLENAAIGTPFDAFARGLDRQDAFEAILQKYHILPEAEKSKWLDNMLVRPVTKFLRGVEFYGQLFESLPKISVYRVMTRELGVPPREAAAYVRNHIGMPNSLRRGSAANITTAAIPFYNVFVNGYRDDINLASKGFGKSKSRSSWWIRWAMGGGIWTAMKAFAVLGLFGGTLKKILDGASEYDKTNYHVIPIGTTAGGDFGQKSVYWRIPQDESHRLLNGILYKSIVFAGSAFKGEPSRGMGDIFAFGAGQVPGKNPVLDITANWSAYAMGMNPTDGFRNRPIMSNAEYLAGGWSSVKPMLTWTWDQSGLGNFVRWNPDADTVTETLVSAVPVLNRTLKISDYGYRELQGLGEHEEDATRAKMRLAMPQEVQQLKGELGYLRGLGKDDRTLEQQQRYLMLSAWDRSIYKPYEEAIINDPSSADMYHSALKSNSLPYTRQAMKQ